MVIISNIDSRFYMESESLFYETRKFRWMSYILYNSDVIYISYSQTDKLCPSKSLVNISNERQNDIRFGHVDEPSSCILWYYLQQNLLHSVYRVVRVVNLCILFFLPLCTWNCWCMCVFWPLVTFDSWFMVIWASISHPFIWIFESHNINNIEP